MQNPAVRKASYAKGFRGIANTSHAPADLSLGSIDAYQSWKLATVGINSRHENHHLHTARDLLGRGFDCSSNLPQTRFGKTSCLRRRLCLRGRSPEEKHRQHHPGQDRPPVEHQILAAGDGDIAAIRFLADIEKYFEAAMAGWTVQHLSERQLTLEAVERIVRFVVTETLPLG